MTHHLIVCLASRSQCGTYNLLVSFFVVVVIELLNSSIFVSEGSTTTVCVALTGSIERNITFSLQSSNETGTADSGQ